MIADRTTYSIVYEIWEPPEDKGGKLNSQLILILILTTKFFQKSLVRLRMKITTAKKLHIPTTIFEKTTGSYLFLINTSWPLGQSMKTFKFQLALCHHIK